MEEVLREERRGLRCLMSDFVDGEAERSPTRKWDFVVGGWIANSRLARARTVIPVERFQYRTHCSMLSARIVSQSRRRLRLSLSRDTQVGSTDGLNASWRGKLHGVSAEITYLVH